MKLLTTILFLSICLFGEAQYEMNLNKIPVDSNAEVVIMLEESMFYNYITPNRCSKGAIEDTNCSFGSRLIFYKNYYKALIEEQGITQFNFPFSDYNQFIIDSYLKGTPYFYYWILTHDAKGYFYDYHNSDFNSDYLFQKIRILAPYYHQGLIKINCYFSVRKYSVVRMREVMTDMLTYKYRSLETENSEKSLSNIYIDGSREKFIETRHTDEINKTFLIELFDMYDRFFTRPDVIRKWTRRTKDKLLSDNAFQKSMQDFLGDDYPLFYKVFTNYKNERGYKHGNNKKHIIEDIKAAIEKSKDEKHYFELETGSLYLKHFYDNKKNTRFSLNLDISKSSTIHLLDDGADYYESYTWSHPDLPELDTLQFNSIKIPIENAKLRFYTTPRIIRDYYRDTDIEYFIENDTLKFNY